MTLKQWKKSLKSSTSSWTQFQPNTTSMLCLALVKIGGTLVLVGVPPEGVKFNAHNLISKRRIFAGSMIGGIAETQEMLDFCAKHNVPADIELIQNSRSKRSLRAHGKRRRTLPLRHRLRFIELSSTI